ncbi:peptidase M35 [Actinoplanes philippinensis]|uniref:Peptidyl-Lys metalloendopeptidase n=1 Tax=Actinoplanes philippinensis TaxID=35752 RepID=A0A1I2GQM3_9ACTN|nr:M35 family metallo-endopeptidase [Actinoplanes philippinensis]GIE78012.1 peptidase M35 [Actinoplanes philippinensis]SFF19915.1 peptidyl-Lys metalloendopeptidase [Actinoplanes philippinensis]
MRISRRPLWAACLAVGIAIPAGAAAGASAVAAAGAAGLTTTVQIGQVTGSALTVRVTVRNTSSSAVDVLSRDLPQARASHAVLAVTRDGVPVPYRGKLAKLAAPAAADYTHIPAGGAYAVTVDLADDYDLSQPGTFTVALASTRVRAARDTLRVDTGRATVRTSAGIRGAGKAAGAAPTTTEQVKVAAAAVSITYRGCTTSEQTALKTAVTNAATYSQKSQTWLAANPSGGGAYTTWFGTYSSSRFTRVTSAYSKITSELTSKTLTLDCTSNEDYYAYVYPDQPYVIYLCNAFWTAPATGTDSKAGTLIHESSHFTVNGGTDDHAYGQTAARQLAASNPANAVDNADNYEYFAESR